METVPFLQDIDDEKHYAQLLEVAYCEAATELNDICHSVAKLMHEERFVTIESDEVLEQCEALNRLQFVMIATVQQMIERRRRLADVTAGLADVVLDKESTKE